MNQFTILSPEEMALIIRNELELQKRNEKPTFAKNRELPLTLDKVAEITGVNVDTLRGYIRNRTLPRRQLTKRGLLFLYPSDFDKVLKQPKSG